MFFFLFFTCQVTSPWIPPAILFQPPSHWTHPVFQDQVTQKWKGPLSQDGRPSGKGKLKFYQTGKEVGFFSGTMETGLPQEGVFVVTGLWKYEGTFKDGLRSGYGTLINADVHGRMGKGSQYHGHFENDLFEGQGQLFDPSKQLLYVGAFSKGKPHGQGKLFLIQKGEEILNSSEIWALSNGHDEFRLDEHKLLAEGIWVNGALQQPATAQN